MSLGTGRDRIIILVLALATLAAYWQVFNHEFVNYDDDVYVTENRHVQQGFTAESIAWAFSTGHAGNWHPLTWLSHMLDYQLFGLKAWGHHLSSLILHILNTLLLFQVLRKMTKAIWPSAFVAVVFALHPLHVESVAWVAERKDVLSTFFWMLTMLSYARYADKPNTSRYLLTLLFFTLGLMAKPMLVTLPFVLLLLDVWPLGRLQLGVVKPREKGKTDKAPSRRDLRSQLLPLIQEKIPFLSIAVVSSIVTYIVQQRGGAISTLDALPLEVRAANAIVAYAMYVLKMIWPSDLAVFYPHPGSAIPLWSVVASGLLILLATVLALRSLGKRPFVAVGWFWYVGTLVPVIGLIQVGEQSMADRYTYVPLIGLSVLIAWGLPALVSWWANRRYGLAIGGVGISVTLLILTHTQVSHWQNSITLFQHALSATSRNPTAHYNLGLALAEEGKTTEAIAHYNECLRIKPNSHKAHNNIAVVLGKQGKLQEAITHISKALQLKPDYADAYNNLGIAMALQGKTTEAKDHFAKAIRLDPEYPNTYYNLGLLLAREGKIEESIEHYSEALRLKPDYVEARTERDKGLKLLREKRSGSNLLTP